MKILFGLEKQQINPQEFTSKTFEFIHPTYTHKVLMGS